MSLQFWGAARNVTGSRHLLGYGAKRVLLDCGMFQGRRQESTRLNSKLPFDARSLDAVVLSHAHIDHSGILPVLAKDGYRGPVFCTKATADLLPVMLRDSAYIQEKDAHWLNKRLGHGEKRVEPLYSIDDVETLLGCVEGISYAREFRVIDGIDCVFRDAGHILGSASVHLDCAQAGADPLRLVFSGDLGRDHLPILRDPVPLETADVLIVESTYGNRLHEEILGIEERLGKIVRRTVDRGGKVIIPAFAVGRSQEIVFELHQLMVGGEIPAIPIYIDSPMTLKASHVFAQHRECFDEETWEFIKSGEDPFGFDRMHYVESVEESKDLNNRREPCVIISASGMAEAGRILHHLKNNVGDPRNTILIVGFQGEHTLGRRLEDGAKEVRILGEIYEVRAEVKALHAFSAHADRDDLLAWVGGAKKQPRKIFVVHGEEAASLSLAAALEKQGTAEVIVPSYGESFTL